ncbi:fumarylacetoacetate hydrolase family protein [Zoogloea sp.]|uniref:fumarylacetoacetate hydrolase family protein n=1 Tax=Zoogloea sp. TaxID=49181 RepID=UPI0014161EAE|nr:MAG: fumarylacetoacetate hydrolase family protein [Zoogloea sp.]
MTTPRLAFAAPDIVTLPIRGSGARFPIRRIFCVGRNYHAHAIEMGRPVDKSTTRPFYFLKDASATVESGATIPYPPGTQDYQYEMELVVAIGAHGFRLTEDDAERMVFGYCCGLDMTRRDLQMLARETGRPWDLGKDFEQSAVFTGIVPKGRPGVLDGGEIRLQVNGRTMQRSSLDKLIWSIPELLADLSGFYHLQPGDLIMTGTPEGVGPVWPGDHLSGHIDAVGDIELHIGAPT